MVVITTDSHGGRMEIDDSAVLRGFDLDALQPVADRVGPVFEGS
jgi:hypothetical protein